MDETPIPTPIPPASAVPPLSPADDIKENKDIAALGYAWILAVFVYFWKKDSPFVTFHAKQGIVLFILSILVWAIPVAGRFLELLVLVMMVFGFLGAAQGQWKELPIIGDIASGRWSHVRQSWKDVVQIIVRLWNRLITFIKKAKYVPTPAPVDSAPVHTETVPQTPVAPVPTVIVPDAPATPATPDITPPISPSGPTPPAL